MQTAQKVFDAYFVLTISTVSFKAINHTREW